MTGESSALISGSIEPSDSGGRPRRMGSGTLTRSRRPGWSWAESVVRNVNVGPRRAGVRVRFPETGVGGGSRRPKTPARSPGTRGRLARPTPGPTSDVDLRPEGSFGGSPSLGLSTEEISRGTSECPRRGTSPTPTPAHPVPTGGSTATRGPDPVPRDRVRAQRDL